MPLGFAGQILAYPACIGGSFIMADVCRPVVGQRNFREHCAVDPRSAFRNPESWCAALFRGNPLPSRICPQIAPLVPTVTQELKKITIRDIEHFNAERRDLDAIFLKLIVPPKRRAILARKAKR